MEHTGNWFTRWTGFANVLDLVLLQALFVVAGALRPGYSAIRNAASDLGVGPGGWWFDDTAIALALLKVLLAVAFLLVMRPVMSTGWRWFCALFIALPGLGNVVTATFTEEPSTVAIHSLGSIVVQLSLLVTFFMVGTLLWRSSAWRAFGIYSVLTGVLTLGLIVFLYLTFNPMSALASLHIGGLAERLLILDRDIWYAVLGWQFFSRVPAVAQQRGQRFSPQLGPSGS
jgi:hypothetical membrane protein